MKDNLVRFRLIPYIDASQFPTEVEDYCAEHEISTHYQNDVCYVENDGNIFAKWLAENNIPMNPDNEGWTVAISAT